jgi:hypothetical protein
MAEPEVDDADIFAAMTPLDASEAGVVAGSAAGLKEDITSKDTDRLMDMVNMQLRRKGVTAEDVDLIMASRQKKWSIEVPSVAVEGGTQTRYATIIEEEDMQHLFMEINTGEYDNNCARPDLESWIIGVGAKNDKATVFKRKTILPKKDKDGNDVKLSKREKDKEKRMKNLLKDFPLYDKTKGKGMQILYDSARQVFVMSKQIEDKLILLLRNDYQAGNRVSEVRTKYGKQELMYVDNHKQRIWRRFIRLYIEEMLDDDIRIISIARRWKKAKEEEIKKNTILAAEDVVYSATDSEEEENTHTKGTTRKKNVALGVAKGVAKFKKGKK